MPIPLGSWKINSNGVEGGLTIEEVTASGVVTGMINVLLTGDGRITGFWDENAQELTFSPISTGTPQDGTFLPIVFKGYLFSTPPNPPPGKDLVWTLTGYVQSVDTGTIIRAAPANARRNIFGWFAQITIIT